jgi:excisionase family DNA binding protein
MPINMAPDAVAAVTMTPAQLDKAIADGVVRALKGLGFGARKAKPAAPKIAYTMKEAVAATGLGRTTLYLAIRRGELRVVKKGARTIILDRDLRRWLEGGLPASNV